MGPRGWQVAGGVCAIATALVGGVFMAFSDFLMRSMKMAGEPAGSLVMQSINVRVMFSVFIALFMCMVPASVGLAGAAYAQCGWGLLTAWFAVAAAVYVAGCFAVTGLGNVPLNNDLADLTGSEASEYWETTYLPRWTLLNTIRTVACVVSASFYVAGVAVAGDAPKQPGGVTDATLLIQS